MASFHLSLFLFFTYCAIIVCQEPALGACRVWADPHLLAFPTDEAQENLRMSYHCTQEGRLTVLKNKYIEVTVNVTSRPFWNQDFEIKLLNDRQVLCTITPDQRQCNHLFLDVKNIGSGTDIIHTDADGLYLTVNSYTVDNRTVFDIEIIQPYSLTKESTGACAVRPLTCRLENASPRMKRRKRNNGNEWASKVCDAYMKEAFKAAKNLIGNEGSRMTDHARAACITDLSLTNSHEWGQGAIGFVMMDSLKKANLGRIQRRAKLETVIPAIKQVSLRTAQIILPYLNSSLTLPTIDN